MYKRQPNLSGKVTIGKNISSDAINMLKHKTDMLNKWQLVLTHLKKELAKQKPRSWERTRILQEIRQVKAVIKTFQLEIKNMKKHI